MNTKHSEAKQFLRYIKYRSEVALGELDNIERENIRTMMPCTTLPGKSRTGHIPSRGCVEIKRI